MHVQAGRQRQAGQGRGRQAPRRSRRAIRATRSSRKRSAEAEFDVDEYRGVAGRRRRAPCAPIPRSVEAMIYKGRALLERAAEDDKSRQLRHGARVPSSPRTGSTPRIPSRLFLYLSKSFARRGKAPDAPMPSPRSITRRCLRRRTPACALNSALAWLQRQASSTEARLDLLPIAFNPHGGGEAEAARAAIARIDAERFQGRGRRDRRRPSPMRSADELEL